MPSHARRIVVAFDDSEASRRALDAAADLMGYGSSLNVVHVRRADASEGRTVDLAREHLLRRHVMAQYLERRGDAAPELIEAARAVGADLVVVAQGNGLDDVPGSASAEVVRHAPCDVLVVR